MLVDDAHWANRPSLRFLAYLAERLAALPILLIVAVRPGEPSADRPALLAVRDAAEDGLLRPGSLSEEGVATIVRSELPGADPSFCKACALVTGGNPFLLTALIEQVRTNGDRPDSTTAQRLAELPPESVLDAVVARLERMSPAARAVASAVAVLGDSATLPAVAGLAGLSPEVTSHSADQLATMHLFHPGSPLSYVHPLIRSAVRRSMSPLQRREAHRRGAAVLTEQEAPAEAIAVHLMSASAGSDRHAVGVLRSAARRALATGAADSAVRMLKRALAEQPAPDVYPDVLAELGQAELAAGLPQAVNRLDHAIDLTEDPRRRAQLALARGDALYAQCRFRDAALALLAAREQLGTRPPSSPTRSSSTPGPPASAAW